MTLCVPVVNVEGRCALWIIPDITTESFILTNVQFVTVTYTVVGEYILSQTAKQRAKYLREKYDISVRQWNLMFDKQQGLCAICQKPLQKPAKGKTAAAVDHDHVTGRVRGLLDYRCNRYVVGRHRKTDMIRRLIDYLESDFDGREL